MAATSVIDATRLPNDIKEALLYDSFVKIVRQNPEEHANFEDQNGLLLFKGLIYVPTRIREQVLQAFHDRPVRGHSRIAKMLQLV
jgi:hypothetical protein